MGILQRSVKEERHMTCFKCETGDVGSLEVNNSLVEKKVIVVEE